MKTVMLLLPLLLVGCDKEVDTKVSAKTDDTANAVDKPLEFRNVPVKDDPVAENKRY